MSFKGNSGKTALPGPPNDTPLHTCLGPNLTRRREVVAPKASLAVTPNAYFLECEQPSWAFYTRMRDSSRLKPRWPFESQLPGLG